MQSSLFVCFDGRLYGVNQPDITLYFWQFSTKWELVAIVVQRSLFRHLSWVPTLGHQGIKPTTSAKLAFKSKTQISSLYKYQPNSIVVLR